MGAESPSDFQAGGYEFNHSVTNFDLGRSYGNLSIGIGSEFRVENFVANAGEEASYYGEGAQSFPGIQPQNAVDVNRYNVGFYTDLGYDVNEDFYIGGAARMENYSDFGESFTWKVNGRYKLMDDKVSFRASASTGFRAPSLHQIYMSNIQTLVSGGTISNQGTFNNASPVIRSLGIDELKQENSMNYTFGVAAKPMPGVEFSADIYNVKVDDRIVYSSSIASDDTTSTLGGILNDYNVTSIKFFTNAIDTETEGMDLVASYSGIDLGPGTLGVRLALNFNKTTITNVDSTIIDGVDIFDRKEQSRIVTSRPADKELLGLTYRLNDWTFALNNTRFGEVTWRHGTDAAKDQTFAAKVITDLNINYQATDRVTLNLSVNNLLDVYPDKIDSKGDFVTNLGGRFDYPWEVNQFGFMGTMVSGKLTMKF
jgi:iron complex outermembrane receptor protein